MPEIVIDSLPTTVDSALKRWGELLDAVDRRLSADRRAVTVVRFEGVDQPSYREAELALVALSAAGRIEVESVDLTTLLRDTVHVAESGLAVLTGGSRRVATAFRSADIANANHQLAELLDAVRNLTTLTGAIGQVGGCDLATLTCGSGSADRAIDGVASALGGLVRCQQAGNWAAVADGLEFELAPALAGWREVLDALGSRCCA
jgi:hypothetical protein